MRHSANPLKTKIRRAPHELDAAKQRREDEEEEEEQKKRNAKQAAAKAAAETSLVPYAALPGQPDQGGIVSILGATVESQLSQEISQLSLENSATIGSSLQTIGSSRIDPDDLSVSVLTTG